MNQIRILVGIDEKYTRDKIFDCFKHRNEYKVKLFNRADKNHIESISQNEYDIYWLGKYFIFLKDSF